METKILPLAITMMAGPQILSAILFITGRQPVKKSLAFVVAVALAVPVGVLVAMGVAELVGNKISLHADSGSTGAGKAIEIGLVGLLIAASLRSWLGRRTSEPPKWLGTLQEASIGKAFVVGLLLILLMPSDFVIMLTTGFHLKGAGEPFTKALPFIASTVLIASLPLLVYLVFHRRAVKFMPKVRDWMNANSWAVNIFVYLLFVVLILK